MVKAPSLGTSFALRNATAVTMRPLRRTGVARAQIADADLGIVENATIVVEGGRVRAIATHGAPPKGVESIDLDGRVVMPGFIDPHTHALFAGDRIEDFESIAAGRKPRLGIRYTVEQTRACTLDQLVTIGAQRLALMTVHGTTTAEVKSGYALTAAGEVDLLKAMVRLDSTPGMPHVIPTFCGAHALPPEFDSYDAFVDELCDGILPRVAAEKIARFADAFCEKGYFTAAQSERFLRACAAVGMRLRVHADELAASGGSALAAMLRCASADHLNFIDASGIAALAASGVVAVLCPATTDYLGLERYAPARDLIGAGVPVALATDFNPGTSPCPSLQTVVHLARRHLKMTGPEVIAAVTTQAARSLAFDGGYLDEGSVADLAVLDTRDYREFGYYFGANLVLFAHVGRP